MLIKSARFIVSNTNVQKCPATELPEYAFIGRSNVGKSSLINMLTNHSKLAKTSSKPGKTQLINHFMINDEWYLVDLPGYGYAKQSKKTRAGFGKIILDYMEKREQLTCLFILIDGRLEPQKIDLDFVNEMGGAGIPLALVFTKADKLSKSKLNENIKSFSTQMLEVWDDLPKMFKTSSTKKEGRDELLGYISEINKNVIGS